MGSQSRTSNFTDGLLKVAQTASNLEARLREAETPVLSPRSQARARSIEVRSTRDLIPDVMVTSYSDIARRPRAGTALLVPSTAFEDMDVDQKEAPDVAHARVKSGLLHLPDHSPAEKPRSKMMLLEWGDDEDVANKSFMSLRAASASFTTVWTKAMTVRAMAKRFVRSKAFNLVIGYLILISAAYLGVETDLNTERNGRWNIWLVIEALFTILFTVECCLRRLAVSSSKIYLADYWNVLDLFLACMSCLDTFCLSFVSSNFAWGSMYFVDLIRCVRLLRLARLFRLFRFFDSLWALVAGIIEAFVTLFWTWVMLALIIYFFAIITTRSVGHRHREDDSEIDELFGTVFRSMFTLFQVTTTEGWVTIARKTIQLEPWTSVFYVMYLYVTTFAAMNVVVAVIVENTLDQAESQRTKFQHRQEESKHVACAKIMHMFQQADSDQNGSLTREEFRRELRNPEVTECLHALGIDTRQAENLFSILDFDESDTLDATEFVGGMMKAVGLAKARDVLSVECDHLRSQTKVMQRVAKLRKKVEARVSAVEQGVRCLRTDVSEAIRKITKDDRAGLVEVPDYRSASPNPANLSQGKPLGSVLVDGGLLNKTIQNRGRAFFSHADSQDSSLVSSTASTKRLPSGGPAASAKKIISAFSSAVGLDEMRQTSINSEPLALESTSVGSSLQQALTAGGKKPPSLHFLTEDRRRMEQPPLNAHLEAAEFDGVHAFATEEVVETDDSTSNKLLGVSSSRSEAVAEAEADYEVHAITSLLLAPQPPPMLDPRTPKACPPVALLPGCSDCEDAL